MAVQLSIGFMNFRLLFAVQLVSSALALTAVKNFAQRDKKSSDWIEALDNFKTLVRVVTFGEEIPSHHSNPLQIMIQTDTMSPVKNPFDLPNGWFGKKKPDGAHKKISKKLISKKGRKASKQKKNKKSKTRKMSSISPSQLRDYQSMDDLALLNFLVQLEEPQTRAFIQSPKKKKQLSSLVTAENRYNEIKKKISMNQSISNASKMRSKKISRIDSDSLKSKKSGKTFSKVFVQKSDKDGKKTKKWSERFNMKDAKNTLTLSVAFGVIVTALFCVVVQLFKLFANTKGSGSGGAFEQINRRSTYGYDKIALDIEDDEENVQSN